MHKWSSSWFRAIDLESICEKIIIVSVGLKGLPAGIYRKKGKWIQKTEWCKNFRSINFYIKLHLKNDTVGIVNQVTYNKSPYHLSPLNFLQKSKLFYLPWDAFCKTTNILYNGDSLGNLMQLCSSLGSYVLITTNCGHLFSVSLNARWK